jgi:predicted DNA-binding protein (MmcQ/YjbR family)
MTLDSIEKICKSFPDVTEDIKWENHLCFNVGGKMFLITSPDDVPISASFKSSEEAFDELSEREGCQPAPYLARYKWIHVDDINRFTAKEWKELLNVAYETIRAKLPRKKKLIAKKKK